MNASYCILNGEDYIIKVIIELSSDFYVISICIFEKVKTLVLKAQKADIFFKNAISFDLRLKHTLYCIKVYVYMQWVGQPLFRYDSRRQSKERQVVKSYLLFSWTKTSIYLQGWSMNVCISLHSPYSENIDKWGGGNMGSFRISFVIREVNFFCNWEKSTDRDHSV